MEEGKRNVRLGRPGRDGKRAACQGVRQGGGTFGGSDHGLMGLGWLFVISSGDRSDGSLDLGDGGTHVG